jgi:hypothetical protein
MSFVLSRCRGVCVTYKTGFGLDDWIYCTLYIHNSGLQAKRYRYSTHFQFTVTHILVFSVFTSRILGTNLSQSHCNFKSHVEPSLHSLIPFFFFVISSQSPSTAISRSQLFKRTLLKLNSLTSDN